jgi:hypothetical protein
MRSATLAFMAAAIIAAPVLAESAKAEPIPYSQLKASPKAKPAQPARRDGRVSESRARTGVAADTSVTAAAPKPTAGADAKSDVNRRTGLSRDSAVIGAPAGPVNPFPPGETEPPV